MSYTVKRGDTLSAIAKKLNTTVARLQELNNKTVIDANKIYAGQKLNVRSSEAFKPSVKASVVDNFLSKNRDQGDVKIQKTSAPVNPRQRAMLSRREVAPTESRSLMGRSGRSPAKIRKSKLALTKEQQRELLSRSYTPDVLGLGRKGLESIGVNVDPFVVAFNQAKLSVAERVFGPDSDVVKSLAVPITEKELGNPVVKALRNGAFNMFREGESKLSYKAQGTTRPGDIFETGVSGLFESLSPSKAASYVTGDTSKGNFTLDENNNLILNDTYDFPDVSEYQAYEGPRAGLYLKVHNMFEPRGSTGEEGLTSGLFDVSAENTRKMRINLGKAPQDIINMIQSQNQMYASAGSLEAPAG